MAWLHKEELSSLAERFFWAMQRGFIPGGRINNAAGTDIQSHVDQLLVQPVGDSVSTPACGKTSIYQALQEAAETMRRSGGEGYNFSYIPPAWRDGEEAPRRALPPGFVHEGV